MLLNERNEFEEMLVILFDAYLKEVSEMKVNTWFSLFEKFSLDEIKVAMQTCMRKEEYLPNPAKVMKYLPSKIHDISAEEAWDFVPKLETESGYVTSRMMRALGVAEELLAVGDTIGARLSFIRTYNNLPADNKFYYSEAYGVDYEEKEQRKINDYKLLAGKGWMSKEQLKMITPSRLLMIENTSEKTQKESNKKQAAKLRSTIKEMLCLNQKNTSQV